MINIAIVEDDSLFYRELSAYLDRFQREEKVQFSIAYFQNGLEFISAYKPCDIVLMDIEMPLMDGMSAAAKLRELDQTVCLIFITNMAQYAIKGYEVEALDYMLKPIRYRELATKLKKALKRCARGEQSITFNNKGVVQRLLVDKILYIEVMNNLVTYHTEMGDYQEHRTLKSVEEQLNDPLFSRCSSSYLVNLRRVSGVIKNEVIVGPSRLLISCNRKKDFMNALTMYLGGTL